jgi:hypothetical protein
MSSEVQPKWMNSVTRHDFGVVAEALLEPVLHGLHVMVGGGLDGLDGLAVGHREV